MTLHSSVAGVAIGSCHGNKLYPDSVHISYLPLAHIYEYFCEVVSMACGAAIGYSCGDNLRLLEDFAVIKPTVSFTTFCFDDFESVLTVYSSLVRRIGSSSTQQDLPSYQGANSRCTGSQRCSRSQSFRS